MRTLLIVFCLSFIVTPPAPSLAEAKKSAKKPAPAPKPADPDPPYNPPPAEERTPITTKPQ